MQNPTGGATDGSQAKTISMSAADFTKLKTLWVDSGKTTYTPALGFEGDVYVDNMVSGTLLNGAARVG